MNKECNHILDKESFEYLDKVLLDEFVIKEGKGFALGYFLGLLNCDFITKRQYNVLVKHTNSINNVLPPKRLTVRKGGF